MLHAQILDCTLRDGAYLVDKKFGDNTIRGIIEGLVKAKMDFIEIGFFQDEGFGNGKTVFRNSQDAARFVPEDKKNSKFTVLADYSRFSVKNLDVRRPDSVDAVRECFFKKERFEAMKYCREIKEKGYLVFVQPVDILGYSDRELIELLELVNEVEPYCLSIVDTFGSMYQEDLHRIFELIHHNLVSTCRIGFHSHNNMQLSNALSQEFIRMTYGKREVIVDGTIAGMGRGAGNTPTELIAQYMVSQLGYSYDIDAILDIIDEYMDHIRSRCTWGYSTPYFVAGCYSAHVNNIGYLTKKNSIRSRDIRFILNKIGSAERKRYNYELLENTYVDYLKTDIDDRVAMKKLEALLTGRTVLILAPGKSVQEEKEKINQYILETAPIIVSVNFIHTEIRADLMYISNIKRYQYWKDQLPFQHQKKIIASNIKLQADDDTEQIVSFAKLVKCGWEHMDNSTIMLLRLLDKFSLNTIAIAGFDGYSYGGREVSNFVMEEMELSTVKENPAELNDEITGMLSDYIQSRERETPILFVTDSRFRKCMAADMWQPDCKQEEKEMNGKMSGGGIS